MTRYPQTVLVSVEIPWDSQGNLLEDVFREEIDRTLQHYNHLYIFGTAGEGYAVNTAQYQQIVHIFYDATRGDDIHPMVGLIGLSTPIILEKLAFAYEVGFRVFQVSLPSWGVLTDSEVMTFFQDVCGAYPDAQFLHYNLPRTGRVLEADDYIPLIEAIPNLVATKNTGGGMARAAALISKAGELQHFLGEGNFLQGCLYGECSLLATFGKLTPRKSKQYFEAAQRGDHLTMIEMQQGFHNLLQDLFAHLKGERRIDGAYDKLWTKLGGQDDFPLRLLSPYHGFEESHFQACKQMLSKKYMDWMVW